LIVYSSERVDAPGKDDSVKDGMGDHCTAKLPVPLKPIENSKPANAAKIVVLAPYDQWMAAKINVDRTIVILIEAPRKKRPDNSARARKSAC
jgi:hypothetical protein